MANQELDNFEGTDPRNRLYYPTNIGGPAIDTGIPRSVSTGDNSEGRLTDLQKAIKAGLGAEDTTNYAYETSDVSKKYPVTFKGIDNEELYAQNQDWTDKMVNSVGKGLLLTGSTFLQGTVGLVAGLTAAAKDGRLASFYDNDFNRGIDEINKKAEEEWMPNYESQAYRDASWYSPSKIFSANFLFEGIIKNLGFAAGAALSGGVYAAALKSLPLTARLFSVGKSAEAVAATEQGLLSANKLASTYGKVKSLSDKFTSSYNILNAGGRATVAGLATIGEASIEAYHNLNDFRNKAIEEYKKQHFGLAPVGDDLARINEMADSAGNYSFLYNTALLTATNYIQFPKILGSSAKIEKSIIDDVTREIGDIVKDGTGKYVTSEATTRAGKLLAGIKKVQPYVFAPSEAFEEGAQYAIQIGVQDYYNKKNKGNAASFADSLAEGVKAVGTNEGMENLLIGGLSGALMTARGTYRERSAMEKATGEALQAFNNNQLSDFTKSTKDAVNRGVTIQEEREERLRQGDILESKDLEADYIINYLTPRIMFNRFDLVKSDIEEYKRIAQTEEGFAQLQAEGKALEGDTRESYLQRLANLEVTADNMVSLYQSLNLRYASSLNAKGERLYNKEVIEKMLYAATKVADYDNRIPQLADNLTGSVPSVFEALDQLVNGEGDAFTKAMADIDSLDILSEVKDGLKQDLSDLGDIVLRRQMFFKEYDDIKNNPAKYTTPDATTETKDSSNVKKVKVTTKDGDEELEVGTEYYAGAKPIEVEEGGTINKYSKFTILGETEDGESINILLPNKTTMTVKKSAFEKYKIGKVADTDKRENAKFFIDTTDHIFTYQLGKGNEKEGSLSYDPKTDKLTFISFDGKFKKQVTRDQFNAKEGYRLGQIYSNKKFTTKAEAALKAEVTLQEKMATRNKIVVDLYNDSKKRLDEVLATLDKNKNKLASLEEALDNVTKTAKGLPRKKLTRAITKAINDLSKTKQDIENQNVELQFEKEELEAILPYFQDMADNIGELEGTGTELLAGLKEDINALEEMISTTGDAIKQGNSLVESIDAALRTALSLFDDFVKRLKEENPNVPFYLSEYQDRIEKYLGEEGARQLIADRLGFTELVLELEQSLTDTAEELKIPGMEAKLQKLQEQLKELDNGIDDLINEQLAKAKVLEAFEQYAENAKKQKEEEELLRKSQAIMQEFLGVNSKDVQNTVSFTKYEAASKKPWWSVVGGTSGINVGKAHQIRANKFGFKFHSLENKDSIRGIVVTAATEKDILPGLIAQLTNDGKDAEPSDVIALVMVQLNEDGTYTLVDENGAPIPEGTDAVNSAIYQVFPSDKLTATYDGETQSMFRSSTPDDIKASLEEQYRNWRKEMLAQETLGQPRGVEASFGIPDYVYKDAEGKERDYEARTSAQDAGLVTEATLAEEPVITVATKNEAISSDNGSVTFTTPLGRVFLKVPGGLVKLLNRTFNKREAELIYDVLHQISKNALADKTIKKERSQLLIDWLKSTLYWGIAKNTQTGELKEPGRNNIWFQDVNEDGQKITKLFISGKGLNYNFLPSELEANKDVIINILKEMYNNVNATMVNDKAFNDPYFEITGLNEDGTPIFKEWVNYQSYLLSSTGRPAEDIPMGTAFKPLIKGETNRKAIYFTLTDTQDDFELPKPAPVVTAKPVSQEAPKPATAPVATPNGAYVLDGTTKNTLVLNGGLGTVQFTADASTYDPATGSMTIGFEADETTTQNLLDKLGTEDEVNRILGGTILGKVKPQLDVVAIPVETVTEEVTEEEAEKFDDNFTPPPPSDELYRLQVVNEIKGNTSEDWTKLESWFKAKMPKIPIYRVKNVIQATNGKQAWGMFRDGAIYIYENAEVGTAYHEVFHAVMTMFTGTQERAEIFNEFKSRKGTFTDVDGNTVKYSDATYKQAEEVLAEEFKDYILSGKIPGKPETGRPSILKFFSDLLSFIKEMIVGPNALSNTEKLFDRIGTGYYATIVPYEANLAYAKEGIIDIEDAQATADSQFSIATIPVTQVHEIMEDMTYNTLAKLSKDNESLFNVPILNKTKLYEDLRKDLTDSLNAKLYMIAQALNKGEITEAEASAAKKNIRILEKNIDLEWSNIIKKHKEFLKTYSVEFDENDQAILTDEDASGKSDWQDARKMDNFKKANSAIKLLVGTLPLVQVAADGSVKPKRSSIGGKILMSSDKSFITLMTNLHSATNIDEMMDRLRTLAEQDPTYRLLYSRVAKRDVNVPGINYEQLKNPHDLQLVTAFWRTFKRQNADVRIVFTLPSGEVVVGDSALSSAAKQARSEMSSDIISMIRSGIPYIKYDTSKKEYTSQAAINNVVLKPNTLSTYTEFLEKLGITFSPKQLRKLTPSQRATFVDAVEGIKESLENLSGVKALTTKALDIDNRLLQLGNIRAVLANPEFESTYFNLNGERTQTFIGTNLMSDMYDVISGVTKYQDLADTKYKYLLNDVFSQGSATLGKMFNIDPTTLTGNRKANTGELMKTAYVDGSVNEQTNKKKESSRLNYKERLVQEINLNLDGYYMNLVPGDASIEWMVNLGTFISQEVLSKTGMTNVHKIFKEYFMSELNLSREARSIVQDKSETRSTYDLRFFKNMLDPKTHDSIVTMIKAGKSNEQIFDKYQSAVEKAVENTIAKEVANSRETLEKYDVIRNTEDGTVASGIAFSENKNLDDETLNRQLQGLAINYMIANIELHKLVYSDPYQYTDELKRIKNFNSPRQPLVANSEAINVAMNNVYNKGFDKDDKIGYTNFVRDYFRTITLADVFSFNSLPGYEKSFEETDGGGYITMKAYRNFRFRAGQWNSAEEKQFRFDVAYEKLAKSGASKEELAEFNKKNPGVMSAYTPIKPIVSGNKADGNNYNDVVLDKFALVPLSFRVLNEINTEANAIVLYNQMQDQDIDYAVFATGRKVGSNEKNDIYEDNGKVKTTPFVGITNIPFDIIGVQAEVPSKDSPKVTQGSQITKLVTMDFMAAGVPVDFEPELDFDDRFTKWTNLVDKGSYNNGKNLYNQLFENRELLEAKMEHGYEMLLKKLGIQKVGKGFKINNVSKLIDTLTDEILKREVNENITDAFQGFKDGVVVLEATPAYQQIRNILYAIADKSVISPKISGGMKVQVPSTLLESVRATKTDKGAYQSDVLKFYEDEDGKRVCEVMIGRWFNSKMTDAELMDYLNSPEGQEILKGIGFRIPTQKQNSIDVFRVAKILPKEFGDSIIIPSALVKKAGSDFDIDKLSIYLKNVLVNSAIGKPVLIPYFGTGEEAKKKLSAWAIKNELDTLTLIPKRGETLEEMDTEDFDDRTEEDILYGKSLENAYIKSLEGLISSPENFKALVAPNSADQMKDVAKEINKLLGREEINYSSTGNMLSRIFMSGLRQAFVAGKYAIGIAATAQTNHSQSQRAPIYIDRDKLLNRNVHPEDLTWLGDGIVNLPHNSIMINGRRSATLSMIKNVAGDTISDLIGQFIDGYVDISKGPWIMEMGATPNTAGTWLFLVKLGVPVNTVAYFMNQPIVREYLANVENAGYSWLFIDSLMEETADNYGGGGVEVEMPNEAGLRKMVGKDSKDLNPTQLAQQRLILTEFLKYAKMSSHLLEVVQGSNFDTATINDPYLVFKKMMQLKRARKTIISSVDTLLESSFMNVLKNTIGDIRNAFSEILVSDKTNVRATLEAVLEPYVNLNDKEFVKLSRKAVNDLFDFAVQTDRRINNYVTNILLGDANVKSAATEIMDFKTKVMNNPEHPLHNNLIIKSIQKRPGIKEGSPDNLYLTGKDAKAYNQNQIIYAFRELKKAAPAGLYGRLVRLAFLQSGLNNSPISFTSLLPYEDFKELYNETLAKIEEIPNLANFYNLDVFQRNNWSDTNIVPSKKAEWKQSNKTKKWYSKPFNPSEMSFIRKELKLAKQKGLISEVLNISTLSREGRSKFITFVWEDGKFTKEEKNAKRKKGDFSYIKKGLFKRVEDSFGEPLISSTEGKDGTIYDSYIYKAINAWGDGFRANELYDDVRQSVIDNGYIKVKEVEDSVIENLLINKSDVTTKTPSNTNIVNALKATETIEKNCKS